MNIKDRTTTLFSLNNGELIMNVFMEKNYECNSSHARYEVKRKMVNIDRFQTMLSTINKTDALKELRKLYLNDKPNKEVASIKFNETLHKQRLARSVSIY